MGSSIRTTDGNDRTRQTPACAWRAAASAPPLPTDSGGITAMPDATRAERRGDVRRA
eukprot:gene2686-12855_t